MACNMQDKIQGHKYFLDTKPVQLKTPTGQVKISCDLNLKERKTGQKLIRHYRASQLIDVCLSVLYLRHLSKKTV